MPLLLQTCARECAYYQVLTGDGGQQADRVLTGYFGAESREKLFAAYATDHPELDDIALRVAIMTDERYIIRTGRYADAQSVHAPVWRSRYDGPYTAQLADPRLAPHQELLDGAHGADGVGIWEGGDGLAANLHDAWGAFATTGDPGWERYTAVSRRAMIFGHAGPYLADDPVRARPARRGARWTGSRPPGGRITDAAAAGTPAAPAAAPTRGSPVRGLRLGGRQPQRQHGPVVVPDSRDPSARAERDQRLPGRQFGLFIDISERDRGSRRRAE